MDFITARDNSYRNRVSEGDTRTMLKDIFTVKGDIKAGETVTCQDDTNAGFNGIEVYVSTADGRGRVVSTGYLSRA